MSDYDDDVEVALRLLDRMLARYLPLKVADALMEIARETAPGNDMRLETAVQRFAALLPQEVTS